jgi:hypothetical protein
VGCITFPPYRPYKDVRVNRTESVSLSVLALLSSVLATLEAPLSTSAAIGMSFLTIVPAFALGGLVVYGYLGQLKQIMSSVKQHAITRFSKTSASSPTAHAGIDNYMMIVGMAFSL